MRIRMTNLGYRITFSGSSLQKRMGEESSSPGKFHPQGRVAAHLTVRSPHRSPPADFPHGPLQQLIHSTARVCIFAKGMYNLGRRNGNDFLIL